MLYNDLFFVHVSPVIRLQIAINVSLTKNHHHRIASGHVIALSIESRLVHTGSGDAVTGGSSVDRKLSGH